MDHWYDSIQDTAPENCTLIKLIAYVVWQCHMRGVHHAGQQQFIVNKVLSAYAYT